MPERVCREPALCPGIVAEAEKACHTAIRPVVSTAVQVEVPAHVMAVPSGKVVTPIDNDRHLVETFRVVGRIDLHDFSQLCTSRSEGFPVRPRLEGPDAVQRPAAGNRTHHALQVLPGQLPDVVENQAMPNVEDRVPWIQPGYRLILGKAFSIRGGGCGGGAPVPGRSRVHPVAVEVVPC